VAHAELLQRALSIFKNELVHFTQPLFGQVFMLIDNSEVVIFFAHFEYGSALKFVLVVDV
jgi:hypothetical protein